MSYLSDEREKEGIWIVARQNTGETLESRLEQR